MTPNTCLGIPRWLSTKESVCNAGGNHGFDPWVRKILWRRAWQPTLVFLPEERYGQRSLQVRGLQRVEHDCACMHTAHETPAWDEIKAGMLLGLGFLSQVFVNSSSGVPSEIILHISPKTAIF